MEQVSEALPTEESYTDMDFDEPNTMYRTA